MTHRTSTKTTLPGCRFLCLLVLLLSALATARGEILAFDDFGRTTGDLNGSDGGEKWASLWHLTRKAAATAEFQIQAAQDGGHFLLAKCAGAKRAYVLRQFEDFSGDKIFVRFQIEAEELPDAAGSFHFFLHNEDSYSAAYRLGMGIKEGALMARYYPDKGGTLKGPPAETGRPYTLVGEFSKSTGGDFDTVRFWVDPGPDDYFSHAGEVSLPTQRTAGEPAKHRTQSVNTAGFILDGEHSGAVRIRDLVIATDWSDVAGPKE